MNLYVVGAVILLSTIYCEATLCSKSSNPVNCVTCSQNVSKYRCPDQCGEDRDATLCLVVCSSKCLGGECEFRKSGKLRCTKGCVDSYSGSYCQKPCFKGCSKCLRKPYRCVKCKTGLYGDLCDKKCSNCHGKSCDKSGTCSEGCKVGWYGDKCDHNCSNCIGQVCDRSGNCSDGCRLGWYGEKCDQNCSECLGGGCDRTGNCTDGCTPGLFGAACDRECVHCRQCNNSDVNCTACDRNDGTCLLGCKDGFHGVTCLVPCPQNCTQCAQSTGNCERCVSGWFGDRCNRSCENCTSQGCHLNGTCLECDETVNCTLPGVVPQHTTSPSGIESEISKTSRLKQTTRSPKVVNLRNNDGRTETDGDEEIKTGGGLSSMFNDQDYLLPLIGGGVVVCAIVALVIFCKCKRKRKSKNPNSDPEGGDDSKCNGGSLHPAVYRTSGESLSSRESILSKVSSMSSAKSSSKSLLMDTVVSSGSPFGEKSFASMRTRSSIPFMDPIVEDEEGEEKEEEEEEEPCDEGRKKINIYLCPEDLLCSKDSLDDEVEEVDIPKIVIEAVDTSRDLNSGLEMEENCGQNSKRQEWGPRLVNGSCVVPVECNIPANDGRTLPQVSEFQSPVIPETETGYSTIETVGSEADALVSQDEPEHKPKYISHRGSNKSRKPRAYRSKHDNGTKIGFSHDSDQSSETEPMLSC